MSGSWVAKRIAPSHFLIKAAPNAVGTIAVCWEALHADLLAAAPDLLAALKQHQEWLHSEVCAEGCSKRCVEARALIAKAEGK